MESDEAQEWGEAKREAAQVSREVAVWAATKQ